jgi:hypothetical protein
MGIWKTKMEDINLRIAPYNVLVFEPELVGPRFQMAAGVIDGLAAKVDENKGLLKELVRFLSTDWTLPNLTLEEFTRKQKGEIIPEGLIKKNFYTYASNEGRDFCKFANSGGKFPPEKDRFVINSETYRPKGSSVITVPRTLDKFDALYDTMAKEGIQIAFFNTLCEDQNGYDALARNINLGRYPALDRAVWFATDAPTLFPMSKEFRDELTKKEARRAEETSASFGSARLIQGIGGKSSQRDMVSRIEDCTDYIHKRLQYIREYGGYDSSPTENVSPTDETKVVAKAYIKPDTKTIVGPEQNHSTGGKKHESSRRKLFE